MAKVNDEGKEYIADVSSGLRLTADIPNGELGYVLMAQLVTRYGITELLGITESGLNTQTRVGVYKYSIMKSDASKTDYGLLFVYSSDVPTSGSGDYPLYQTRFQDGKMQTRSRTMPNGLWTDWLEINIDPNRIAFNSDGTKFAATDLNKPRTEGRMSLGSNGDVGVSVGNNGELGIGVNRNSKYYPVMEVKKDNKTRFTPVGSPYVMVQMEKGRIIFSSDQVANSEVGVHLDLNDKVATLKAEDKINLESANETTIKSSGLYVSGIGGYDGTNPGTAKTLQEVVNEGGSPDAVLKDGSNQVGDTFSLTSQNDNGDITVSSGRNGETNLTGGRVRVDSNNGATEIDGMGVNITSTGNASVTAYGVSLNATNGKAEVEGSRGVDISSTDGDINLNPGGEGKAKVNGKEIATVDQIGSSVEVVQTTGQSTTAVMSQKAVTDTIGNLSSNVMRDEGLYEDVDTLGETFSRTSTNGEQVSYINHRIEEYAVGADAPDIFTYDEQVHTLKLAQFTVHPQEGDLSFIEQNSRGVLLDPTWSYVNFICSNEPRYFSARIGGGKCVLVDTNGETSGDHYIQLFAEAAYSASTGNIEVSIFAEYKLSGGGAENNPLYINGNLPGYLRIWIV